MAFDIEVRSLQRSFERLLQTRRVSSDKAPPNSRVSKDTMMKAGADSDGSRLRKARQRGRSDQVPYRAPWLDWSTVALYITMSTCVIGIFLSVTYPTFLYAVWRTFQVLKGTISLKGHDISYIEGFGPETMRYRFDAIRLDELMETMETIRAYMTFQKTPRETLIFPSAGDTSLWGQEIMSITQRMKRSLKDVPLGDLRHVPIEEANELADSITRILNQTEMLSRAIYSTAGSLSNQRKLISTATADLQGFATAIDDVTMDFWDIRAILSTFVTHLEKKAPSPRVIKYVSMYEVNGKRRFMSFWTSVNLLTTAFDEINSHVLVTLKGLHVIRYELDRAIKDIKALMEDPSQASAENLRKRLEKIRQTPYTRQSLELHRMEEELVERTASLAAIRYEVRLEGEVRW